MPRPLTRRFARFGPPDARWLAHVPEDGFCVSAFVFVRDRRGSILLGRPRPHRDWPEKGCVPLWRLAETTGHGEWVLPASHFLMDESPDGAARRIASDWAGLPGSRPSLVAVTSELMPTGRTRGRGAKRSPRNHWALCFLYELRARRSPSVRPGWAELRFLSASEMAKTPIGRGHRDLIRRYLATSTSPRRTQG